MRSALFLRSPQIPLLKPLERQGLLTVAADEKDRRSRRLALTDAGQALLASAVGVWQSTHGEVEARVPGANGAAGLVATLRSLSDAGS